MPETFVEPQSIVLPEEIRVQYGVLCLSVLLGVVSSLVDWRRSIRVEDPIFSVVDQIVTYGFMALLIWKISRGRNWARVIWLAFYVSGCLITVRLSLLSATYRVEVFGSFFPAAVFVVQTAIQFYATALLLTARERTWFVRKQ